MTATQADIPQTLAPHLSHLVVDQGRIYCNHGNGLLAPVVDSTEVPVADRNHIPRPDLDGVLAEALSRNLRLLLVGDAGCGKSSGVVQFAARLGWPLRRVNLNGETGVSEFVGQWVVRGPGA
ncbi:MAG: hypothetical protein EA402_00660 [Planctomycetota bacterium]|nr:MAG: hypothetical protein EA402_00660 [Planctomycetota bacterium]